MERLPVEIIEKILMCEEMSIKDVCSMSQTCKQFYDITQENNTIWKTKFYQLYPILHDKLENIPLSYHQEVRYSFELKKRTNSLLASMSPKFYKKIELSETDLQEWDWILREKWENYYYLSAHLMNIIHTKVQIDTLEVIPPTSPGHLTQQYYAIKVLRFIRQIYLSRMWRRYISKDPDRQVLEYGAIVVAQWCMPKVEVDAEEIYKNLDDIAEEVKYVLKRDNPDHPIFQATQKQLDLWKVQIRPENEWSPHECRKILAAMKEVIFQNMGFIGFAHMEPSHSTKEDCYINAVLKTKRGTAICLAVIFEAVARRLGLRCEPIVFPSHFLLRFCESKHPKSDWYYIDVFNGGQVIRRVACPHSGFTGSRDMFPMATADQVIARIANDLENMARQSYSPSGRVTRIRSTLELIQMVNPKDITALVNLGRLYMLHNFNTSHLENFLANSEFDIPEAAERLITMLREYQPDPPEGPIEAVQRPKEVKFAVGMVMYHVVLGYRCVIFNWDPKCLAATDWQWRNNVENLRHKGKQPFYNVLVEDGSHRYVAQENLKPIFERQPLQLNDEVGRHFSHFYKTHYVPNAEKEYNFPADRVVRLKFHNLLMSCGSEV